MCIVPCVAVDILSKRAARTKETTDSLSLAVSFLRSARLKRNRLLRRLYALQSNKLVDRCLVVMLTIMWRAVNNISGKYHSYIYLLEEHQLQQFEKTSLIILALLNFT